MNYTVLNYTTLKYSVSFVHVMSSNPAGCLLFHIFPPGSGTEIDLNDYAFV